MNLIKPLVPQPVANPAGIKAPSMSPLCVLPSFVLILAFYIHNKFLAGPLLATPNQLSISILTTSQICMHELLAIIRAKATPTQPFPKVGWIYV